MQCFRPIQFSHRSMCSSTDCRWVSLLLHFSTAACHACLPVSLTSICSPHLSGLSWSGAYPRCLFACLLAYLPACLSSCCSLSSCTAVCDLPCYGFPPLLFMVGMWLFQPLIHLTLRLALLTSLFSGRKVGPDESSVCDVQSMCTCMCAASTLSALKGQLVPSQSIDQSITFIVLRANRGPTDCPT